MRLLLYIRKARKLPFKVVCKKGKDLIKRNINKKLKKYRDNKNITYSMDKNKSLINYKLNLIYSEGDEEKVIDIVNLYLNHQFDLLGSGWIQQKYNIDCCGLGKYKYKADNIDISSGNWLDNIVNKSNIEYAKFVYNKIDKDYELIDWQLDFKSGYRWSNKTWYMDIKYADKLGVDIKVPWELARMQHLVMLARAYSIDKDDKYKREFINQILDFIAFNPPRFGVNWRCTMDVGIRISNWLIAYDIFKSLGITFDKDFENILANSTYDHAKHIINNLEYTPNLRFNHYLSDIVGLFFASSHLKSTEETDRWLAFSLQELTSEMEHEFHDDGSNFEGSTSYHRLSAELIIYASLFATSISKKRRERLKKYDERKHLVQPKLNKIDKQAFNLDDKAIFPLSYWEKIAKILIFTKSILKDNNKIPQIGDNDSGRFLKINPVYNKISIDEVKNIYYNLKDYYIKGIDVYFDEDILDHRHLVDIYNVLFKNTKINNIEMALINNFRNNLPIIDIKRLEVENENNKIGDIKDVLLIKEKLNTGKLKNIAYEFKSNKNLLQNIKTYSFWGMGLYIFKSSNLYMSVRCGEIGQNNNGGHCHNDQLSITLNINGKDIINDPGTYVYMPLADERNKFRSTKNHFTIQKDDIEQNKWFEGREGLFSLIEDKTKAECIYLSNNCIICRHFGFGEPVYRIIDILENKVVINDYGRNIIESKIPSMYSNGYGKIMKKGLKI